MNRFLKGKSGAVDKQILVIACIVVIGVFFFSQLKQVVKCHHGKTESRLEFVLFKSDEKYNDKECSGSAEATPDENTGDNGSGNGGGKVGGEGSGSGNGIPSEDSDIDIPDDFIPISYYDKFDSSLVCKNTNSYYPFKIAKEAGPQAKGTKTLTITNKQGWDMWLRVSKVDTANGLSVSMEPTLFAHIPNGEKVTLNVDWHWNVPFNYSGNKGEAVLYFESKCDKPSDDMIFVPLPYVNDLKVVKKNDKSVTLQWKPSEFAVKYRLERFTLPDERLEFSTYDADLGFEDNNVKPQTSYRYRLTVYNSEGKYTSSYVNVNTDISPLRPATPNNFTTTHITENEVSLKWDFVPSATSYTVKIGDTPVWTGTNLTYKASNLNSNEQYTFSVRANNSFGFSNDATLSAKTLAKRGSPPTPLNFKIIDITETTMTLQWTSQINTTSYVLKSQNSTPTIWEGTNTTYKVIGLKPGTTYTFLLYGKNNIGLSANHASVSATTKGVAPTPAPTNFIIENVTNHEQTLRWNPVSVADYYVLKDNNGTILYQGTQTSYRVSNLKQNTNYTYHVRAVGSRGESSWTTKSGYTANFLYYDDENINDTCRPSTLNQTFVLPKDAKPGTAGIFEYKVNNTLDSKLKTRVEKVETNGKLFTGNYPIIIEYNENINQVAPKTNFTYSFKWIFPSQGVVDSNPNASNSIYVEIETECI